MASHPRYTQDIQGCGFCCVKGTQAVVSLELCELPAQGKRVSEEQDFHCPAYPKLAKELPAMGSLVLPTRATLVLRLTAK